MTESSAVAPSLVVLAAGMARRYGGCKPLAPIGPHGEAVLDLLVSDAVRAGFGRIVLVLHPETGPAIRYHVEQCWPEAVDVSFATQRLPLGTVHAVLAAEEALDGAESFGVSNADDVYGEVAMGLLAGQLSSSAPEHVLVGYALHSTVATDDPVTRGICDLDQSAPNYGWCFDCVPEENSLLLGFGDARFEIPSLDLVFAQPRALLGRGHKAVHDQIHVDQGRAGGN